MASSLSSLSTTVTQHASELIARLPEPAQAAVHNPLVQKAIGALIVLRLLGSVNNVLSSYVLNNFTSDKWDWPNEIVLVTGGCSGIGKQVALDLAAKGTKVIIVDVQEPNFTLPRNVHFYKSDVTSSEKVKEVGAKIRKDHGDPTVLINNAGIGQEGKILEKSEAFIRKTFEVNTIAHYWTVREFLPAMIKRNHGHIVTVASMASFVSVGEMVEYSCSKASALAFHEGLTQELRHWYGAPKVRTSVIHPIWVRTPLIKTITDAGKLFKQLVLEPEDVSNTIVKHVLSGNSGQVCIPSKLGVYSLIRAFPNWLQELARNKGSKDLKVLRDHEHEIRAKQQQQ